MEDSDRGLVSEIRAIGAAVLDLGCGYGQFINNIQRAQKFAMDLNPGVIGRLIPVVAVHRQDCTSKRDFDDASLDVVFTSNFFEHLPSKEDRAKTIAEARRCLRSGGKLIAMGPNVKFVGGAYWDYFDHHIALTDRSLGGSLGKGGVPDRICARSVSALHYGRLAPLSDLDTSVIFALADPLESIRKAISRDRREVELTRRAFTA